MKNKLINTAILVAIISLITVTYANARPRTKFRNVARYRLSKKSLARTKINNIQFGFDKPYFSEDYKNELNKVVKLMSANNVAVKLGGYADSKGTYLYNWKLSKLRVDNVKAFLISNGADSTRIAATEYGDTQPIASNKTKSGRRRNRRVEIRFAN